MVTCDQEWCRRRLTKAEEGRFFFFFFFTPAEEVRLFCYELKCTLADNRCYMVIDVSPMRDKTISIAFD